MPRILGDPLEGVIRIAALPFESYYPIWLLTHPDLRNAPRVAAFLKSIAAGFVKRRGSMGVAWSCAVKLLVMVGGRCKNLI